MIGRSKSSHPWPHVPVQNSGKQLHTSQAKGGVAGARGKLLIQSKKIDLDLK